jgi:hypothetical protein
LLANGIGIRCLDLAPNERGNIAMADQQTPATAAYPPDRKLNIFISHKIPADTTLAKKIGSKLARFGANRVVVRFAEQYPYGDNWREHIQSDINKSDMMIYLHTGEYDDWLYCLFECGMFVNRPNRADDSLGVTTFCKTAENISSPLREFNALVISKDAVIKLFRQIYIDSPWQINPSLTDDDFVDDATDIVSEFTRSFYIVHNFDVTPGIIIELDNDSSTLQSVASAALPGAAIISGVMEWPKLVGKDINTGEWTWAELRPDWPYATVYEYLLAKSIDRALRGLSTRAFLLRSPTASLLYRVALRRYEELSNDKYKFYFTAAPLDLPFDIPSERAEKREVVLYHLVNLTWYFRRRFVDELYNRLLEIAAKPETERIGSNELFEEIAYELMDIDAQTISRRIDSPLVVQDALGKDDPHVIEIMVHAKKWYELRPEILKMIKDSPGMVSEIATKMHQITIINRELYIAAAEAYNLSAKALKAPTPP